MCDLVPVIAADRVPVGKPVRVQVNDRCCIVCNDDGSFHVTDGVCPHAGGPLGEGEVRDGCVVCPVHYWPWDLKTGLTDENMPDFRLRVYPCELRDGTVYAAIPHEPPRTNYDLDCRQR
ncbi:MAG: Rieske 2Fe-2S domain-containing protein [Planctomycetes bacterium]|nr:Rieske 2Fe-2S domain-containing protein [Planctomycetota bacterium]